VHAKRGAEEHAISRAPGDADLRDAAQRGGDGFFDKLKSASRGYASLDYEFKEYRAADMVKLDILINGIGSMPCRSWCIVKTRPTAAAIWFANARTDPAPDVRRGGAGAIGSHIIARETVKALRKNVLAKCYGGDVSRKRKLLENRKREEAHETGGHGGNTPGGVSRHTSG